MLCTNYEELVDTIPQINNNQDAVDYCNGIYTADGYRAVCKSIKKSREFYNHNKLYRYTALSDTITKYIIFRGEDPVELKNFYHKCIQHFEWDAIPIIEDDCMFGKAYANAFRRAGNNYYCQIPDARMVFEELSKLLRKCQCSGFIIAEDAKEYLR